MATVNSAIQSLVDHLHGKMTSNEPLTAEEQTLVANAIDKLSQNTTLEQALVAVATEHLDSATTNMSQTFSSATTALTSAQQAIDAAKDDMATQNTNLAIIPQLESQFKGTVNSNFAAMPRTVFGVNKIETTSTSSSYRRSQCIFAIYDSSGETFAVRPSYTQGTSSIDSEKLEYIRLPTSGENQTTIANHYVNNSSYYATPTSSIFYAGASAILPLASKDDGNDIEYDIVYSCQSSASTSTAHYQGIYVKSVGNTTVTKPKKDINATDQWGLSTLTNHSWETVAVLYDNIKHCLILVDDDTSLIIEKYRDGNITTNVSIADSNALQSHVENGNYTVVSFMIHSHNFPNCSYRLGNTGTSASDNRDCYGFFGIIGNDERMGKNTYNAHYRFTDSGILEPLNYFFTSSVSYNRYHGSYGLSTSVADLNVVITDTENNILNHYHFQSKADYFGYSAGYIAGALMCMNPYSNTGILNEHFTYSGTNQNHGIARTCRAF